MKRLVLLLLIPCSLIGQYTFRSPYLRTPELLFGYVDSCAQFWQRAYDPAKGGYYINIDRAGNLVSSWGTGKYMMNQSRDAYGFVRAYMLTGNESYLLSARRALDFMYATAWDKSYGGWIERIDVSGKQTGAADNKTAYYQHYALLGIAAMYEACRDTTDWSWMMKGYAYNEQKLWDSRPQYFGYYDNCLANGTSPSGKSFNATVDAFTTHLLQLYLMTGEEKYRQRMLQIGDNMIIRLAASMPSQSIGFVEGYTSDWAYDPSVTMTIMGHVLKTSWCLARLYMLQPDSAYKATARQLADHVLLRGYDHRFGGPFKDYDRTTGQMLMWGQTDTAKAWWQMEQAITAGLTLGFITGDPAYLTMADETLDFFMTYFVDHTYGDVYQNRTVDGRQIWDLTKGNDGKAGYHSIELGYYTYLYSKLLIKREPVTLYYCITPAANDRVIALNPIGVRDNYLRIAGTTRGGTAYTNINSSERLLTVPAGTGGTFAVTFEPAPASYAGTREPALPLTPRLLQNYPNPFNPSTTISFVLPSASHATVAVYDALGRLAATPADGFYGPGQHTVAWNAGSFPSGVYFCRLVTAGGTTAVKMLLTK